MTPKQLKVFVNYRRADERYFVQSLRTHFMYRYDRENVFMDFDSIPPFTEFEQFIRQTVRECDVVAMMIGPRWVELRREKLVKGEPDYVLIELEEAVQHGKFVAPICYLGGEMPSPADLPPDLHPITKVNAEFIRDERALMDRIERIMTGFESELARRGAARTVANPESQTTIAAAQTATGALNIPEVLKRIAEAVKADDLPQALVWIAQLRASGQTIPETFKLDQREAALQEKLREREESRRRREVADFLYEFVRAHHYLGDPDDDVRTAVERIWHIEDGYMPDDLREVVTRLLRPAAPAVLRITPAQRALLDRMFDERATPAQRADAGRELAAIGDPRPGVGLRADGLPDIEWRFVEGGTFTMGSDKNADPQAYDDETPQHSEDVAAFSIARYPVTYAQYKIFVNEDGYRERYFWTDSGWDWLEFADEIGFDRDTPSLKLSNHPVSVVTWFEAYAFTRWLSIRTGEPIRLPTEAEWEKAARGTDKRIYPYVGPFDAAKGNTNASKIGRTSAVGIFQTGVSPYELLDMSGNVWEWCLTKWRNDYKNKADDTAEGSDGRVMRGGSWNGESRLARAANRHSGNIDYMYLDLGFRIARSDR